MKLTTGQWKMVYDAVRAKQVNCIVDGMEYKQYDEILKELWDAAYSEIYNTLKENEVHH